VALSVHGRYSRAENKAAYCCAEACGYGVLTADAPWIHREGVPWHQTTTCDLLFITLRKSEASSAPPPATATWPSAPPCSTGRARAPPPPPPPPGSGISTTRRGAHGCCCSCGSSGDRARSPSRLCVWGLRGTQAMRGSGSGWFKSGDPLAAGAGDSGGVDARLFLAIPGVGGLRGQFK
jgi:hypothetical protein